MQSLIDWIFVRNALTVLRQSMTTRDAFSHLKQSMSLSRQQRILVAVLQRLYVAKKHKIYSVFACEDFAVRLFHSNLQHVFELSDLHGFWFVVLAFVSFTNRDMMILCQDILMQKDALIQAWRIHGRRRFETAPCTTFKTCTRRGNLVWHRMRENFTSAMDKLGNGLWPRQGASVKLRSVKVLFATMSLLQWCENLACARLDLSNFISCQKCCMNAMKKFPIASVTDPQCLLMYRIVH